MKTLPLMREIGRYNEVDCRAMGEVFVWLRRHR
jgi:predicted RecB family nuclease